MRLKTLNGAPLCHQLDFSESSLLDIGKCRGFHAISLPSTSVLKWRRITNNGVRLRTEWSQPYVARGSSRRNTLNVSLSISYPDKASALLDGDSTSHDSTFSLSEQSPTPDDFLQHSLIFHDALLSSQVLPDDNPDTTFSSSFSHTTSFDTTLSSFNDSSRAGENMLPLQLPSTIAITPLRTLPNAQHLRSIYPQTLTPNFLCVLTTAPHRREVLVRKGAYKMDLWEIITADDTRQDFKISFWFRPLTKQTDKHPHLQNLLLQTLGCVKVGDVLLLRNIALASFRDVVYGQSLNTTITRAHTSIDVLARGGGVSLRRLDALPESVSEALKRVQKWAKAHVAAPGIGSRKRKGSPTGEDKELERSFASLEHESLPPDTMEMI